MGHDARRDLAVVRTWEAVWSWEMDVEGGDGSLVGDSKTMLASALELRVRWTGLDAAWMVVSGWTYLAVEKRMNGDESVNACACDAAQASRAAVVESFIAVVVMPSSCVGVGVSGGMVGNARRLLELLAWLGWMMQQPTAAGQWR